MFIIQHIYHVVQRDISTHKLRICNNIIIVTAQIVKHTLLFKHLYVYAINHTIYDNTIQFVIVNNIYFILTISYNMGYIPMCKVQDLIFQWNHKLYSIYNMYTTIPLSIN